MTVQLTIERATEIVGFEPSPYQLAVFQHVIDQTMALVHRKPMKSLIVKARAGSGKTTTAVAANKIIALLLVAASVEKMVRVFSGERFCKLNIGAKIIFLAFNKTIQTELSERLKKTATEAKTLNGLGHGVLSEFIKSAFNVGYVKLNKVKTYDLMKGLMRYEDRTAFGDMVKTLVDNCKSLGVAPVAPVGHWLNQRVEGLKGLTATDATLRDIVEHFGHDVGPTMEGSIFPAVRDVLIAGFDTAEIDFGDQKYVPVVFTPDEPGSRIAMIKYDLIFVDEAQDVNPTDLELIRLSLRHGGAVIAIGDDHQAIYGFRGADVDSIDNIQKLFDAKIVPLSITYRCATAIVEHLNGIYPGIEAAANAPKGAVVDHDKCDLDMFKHWGADATERQRKNIHDMIVCRNNAPLVKMAFAFIRARRPVHMLGRDFGKELLTLITNLVGDKKKAANAGRFSKATVGELDAKLDEWEQRQIALISAKGGDESAKTKITDKADTVRVFIEDNTDNKVTSVVDEIQKLFHTSEFGEENVGIPTNKIVLTSGHKSKGLEAIRVFFLDSHLLYKRTKPGTWQHVQEKNLEYVICSRPMLHLGFIYSDQLKKAA